MKGKAFLTAASEVLLAALLAWSGAMCMVTAFSLTYVKLWVLPLWCVLSAGAVACCCRWKKGLLLAMVLAVAVGYWWSRTDMLLSLEALVYRISYLYDRGYRWGTVSWSGENLAGVDMTLGLCLVCLPVTAAVGVKLAKGYSGWIALFIAALPFGSCLLLKDTVPEEIYIFLWLLGLLLVLMTQSLRSLDGFHAARLTLMLALPCGALLLALFLLIPKDGYNGQAGAERLEEFVVSAVEKLPDFGNGSGGESDDGDMDHWVDLQDVGPRQKQKDRVMKVVLGKSGTLYLRGRDFGHYDGSSWLTGTGWTALSQWQDTWGEEAWEVAVVTEDVHSVIYLPYTCGDAELLEMMNMGRVPNLQGLKSYKVTQRQSAGYDQSWENTPVSDAYGAEIYLDLPESTSQRARTHLEALGIAPEGEYETMAQVWRTANSIADYVRSSARYDLNTPQMPQGEDFAMWFLEESDTGYCTHFASAAAVLLRAAGIPARFVTGYMVSGTAGQTVSVRLENAHAWVEYYIEGAGWQLLEATASGTHSPAEPTAQVTTVPPEPEQTVREQTLPRQTESEQTGETTPSGGETEQPEAKKPPKSTGLWWLAGIAAVFAAVMGQWRLRLYLFERELKKSGENRKAVLLWQREKLLSRLLEREPEQALYALALKAKFSQHSLTKEELALFDESIAASLAALKRKNPVQQILYRLVYALY